MKVQQSLLRLFLFLGFGCSCYSEPTITKCPEGIESDMALEEAIPKFQNCLIGNLENFRHEVASNTCPGGSLEIDECDVNLEVAILGCQSSDEWYFPKDTLKLIKRYADYICEKATFYKFPVLLDHEICFPSLSHGVHCFSNYKFFNSSIIQVSQEDMCLDEITVRDCLLVYASNMCPKDEIFPRFINETFTSDEEPFTCKGNTISYNFLPPIFTLIAIPFYTYLLQSK